MQEIASCTVGKCFPARVSDDMKGEIHRCSAAAAGDSVAVKHEQLVTDFDVWMQLFERVQMLVMYGCASSRQKPESCENEGTCIERSECDPGTCPASQRCLKHWAAMGF